jgi:hypothetical protein
MGWPLTERDLKRYPHFDGVYPLTELERIATDPKLVAENKFFPFLLYYKSWRPFRKAGNYTKKKKRPIRYAARRDGAIFSYYRYLLSERYEVLLHSLGLKTCPIAYRKIRSADGARGKCNIDFAAEAFQKVRALGTCCVATLDISSYFEKIDHARLYKIWCELLGTTKLPPDHKAVFRAITKYAVVNLHEAYERLDFVGQKQTADGFSSKGFLKPRNCIPVQLCTPAEFRKKICGEDKAFSKLVVQNKEPFGIPQGAPISDLLANIYLLGFDKLMSAYVSALGGAYFRYSDDIFVAVPGDQSAGRAAVAFISNEILKFGEQIKIKDEKTAIVSFTPTSGGVLMATRVDNPKNHVGLEYLGFRFDGKKVYVRDSTMGRFHRKITFAARRRAQALARRYVGKDSAYLLKEFGIADFEARFGRVPNFESGLDHRRWTFRTYIKRCTKVFGDSGHVFFRQTRRHRTFITWTVSNEIERALRDTATSVVTDAVYTDESVGK